MDDHILRLLDLPRILCFFQALLRVIVDIQPQRLIRRHQKTAFPVAKRVPGDLFPMAVFLRIYVIGGHAIHIGTVDSHKCRFPAVRIILLEAKAVPRGLLKVL